MAIRAVVFDVGGVLSRQTDISHFEQWAARLGMQVRDLAYLVFENEIARRATVGAASVADIWCYVGQQLHLSPDDLATFEAGCWNGYEWDQELLAYARALRPRYKTAVLSDAWPNTRQDLAAYLTDDTFDLLMFSAEEKLQKPDPELFQRLFTRLDVNPSETIFVDDRPKNVEGAHQLGIHALLFTTSEAIREQISTLLQETKPINGYDHMAFQVSNMDASIQFYVEKLGFTLNSRAVNAAEGEEYSFLCLGNLRLELIQDLKRSDYKRPEIKAPYCPHLAIETDDMQGVVAALQQKGVPIVHGPQLIEGEETWLYFADPDHNMLEYIQWFHKK